jgi:hypothetical protein
LTERSVTIGLSGFAYEALAGEERIARDHIPARLARAIRDYLSDKDSGRPGWPYPGFLRGREVSGEELDLELSMDDDLWRSLEDEAGRQGVSVGRMIEHAAFYSAAEVNAGRVTQRILDDLEDDGG